MSSMKGKVILISGGTKSIGYSTAEKYLKDGSMVVIGGRNEKTGADAAKTLSQYGEVTYVRCDASEEADCKNIVEKTIEKYGRIDVCWSMLPVWLASVPAFLKTTTRIH